jgi:hypothetical protein
MAVRRLVERPPANQAGIYPIDVFVTVYGNDCFGFPLPQLPDTVSFYFLDVQYAVGVESPPVNAIRNIYPNPASEQLSFDFYANKKASELV